MHELSSVHSKSFLICLVGYAVSDSRTEHHLIATHEVSHDILKRWFECFWVNEIEINFIISGNLDSFVTFDKENKTSRLNFIVLLPFFNKHFVFILLFKNSEENYLT
jgi:hypothetical protein